MTHMTHRPIVYSELQQSQQLTGPEADAVESVGEEVVADAVGAPVGPGARVRHEALRVGPADADERSQVRHGLNVVDNSLVVPLEVDRRALAAAHVDVRVHADGRVHTHTHTHDQS